MRKTVTALYMLMILALLQGCGDKSSDTEELFNYVSVQKADVMVMHNEYKTAGTVKGIEDVYVYPKTGGKLMRYEVSEGDYVRKDQTIALIDRDITGMKYEPALVRSPISGMVGKAAVDVGESVLPGQTPLALISNMDQIEILIELPEKYIHSVSKGNSVKIRVEAYPEKEFDGRVYNFTPVADPVTHTITMKIIASNPGHLIRSGMFAKLNILIERHEGIAVPEEAVINNEYVYVHEGGRAVMKRVKTGFMYNTYVEVVSGLDKGEEVVVAGQKYLDDGVKIKVR